MNKKPWFPFYGTEFFTDENVVGMTDDEVGKYLRLLWLQWSEGSIPQDPGLLERIVFGQSELDARAMQMLSRCFTEHPTLEGRLVNKRLFEEEVRAETIVEKTRKDKSKAGKSGWAGSKREERLLSMRLARDKQREAQGTRDNKQTTTTPLPPSGGTKKKGPGKKPEATEPEQNIFAHWNKQKIIQHEEIDKHLSAIRKAIKEHGEQKVGTAINNYKRVLENPGQYYSHRFTLANFLNRTLDSFLAINKPESNWQNEEIKAPKPKVNFLDPDNLP